MNSREKMDVERSLGAKKESDLSNAVFPRWRMDPVLSPKRESQLLLRWDGKILPSRNGGSQESTDNFERLTTTS
jgi:hypothetical protein